MKPTTNNIDAAHCHHGRKRDREIRECLCGNARQAIGTITPGCEIFGFTKGQFSLMDVIIALLHQTGPAHIDLSTWTAGNADIRHCYSFVETGNITSTRWVVDRSFPTRQPEYFDALVKRFGAKSIRVTNTHAKFCTIQNDEWSLCVRTSMNLNKNPRFENFEISDDPNMAAYFTAIVDEVFERSDCGRIPNSAVTKAFNQLEIMGESYDRSDFTYDPVTL